MARKQELAAEALRVIQQKEDDGHLLAYTNGSVEYVSTHGWIGGWGCYAADGWEKASHLPPHTRQTINRAELQAVIEVVQRYHDRNLKVAVCTDSAYVYGGVQGGAHKWRAWGWVTTWGPVTNVDLWSTLMTLLDSTLVVSDWIKVPSHVAIQGNERADKLAEQGRLSSPLYLTIRHPPQPP